MRNWFSNYFGINKGEFNGLLLLVIFVLALLLAPLTYRLLWPYKVDEAANAETLRALEKVLQAKVIKPAYPSYVDDTTRMEDNGERAYRKRNVVNKPKAILFTFNPNVTPKEDWQKLGLSAKQAQVMVNYVAKGGVFRQVTDLKKMYVISPERYAQLSPFVRLPAAVVPMKKETPYSPKAAVFIEVNQADTLLLLQVKGIGPAFARRIVKYRDRLGGFHKKEQLMEVFGLDSVKFNQIKDQLYVDVTFVKKLNINRVKFEDLKNNPYLRYKQLNAILQYREQHGNYGNFDDLKKVAILTPEILEQLAPYFSFSP